MRLTFLFIASMAFLLTAQAQADTSYHVLWYSGKKLRQNVLLTAARDTVTYFPAKGTVRVVSPKNQASPTDKILVELGKPSKKAQELINRLSTRLPKTVLPTMAGTIRNAYTEVDRQFRKLLPATLSLPAMPMLSGKPSTGKGGHDLDFSWPDIWDDAVKQMEAYRETHANDNLYNVPEPPNFDFAYCYRCNTEASDIYNKQLDEFIAAITGEDDRKMMMFAFGVSRQAEFLLAPPRITTMQVEVTKTLTFIVNRIRKRVSLIIERYVDDAEKSRAVLFAALNLDRQLQLLAVGEPLSEPYMARAFAAYAKRIRQAMAEEDYSIALNFDLLIGTDRQMQLSMSGYYEDILNEALKFNQFRVNMNISAKTGSGEAYLLAQLRGDNWFMAFPDSSCRLKWFLIGPHINKIEMQLESADMRGSGGQIPYVGTKTWEAPASTIRIDFCNYEADSIIAYPFNAENSEELWKFPEPMGTSNVQQVNGLFLSCFIDPDQIRQEADQVKKSDKAQKIEKEMAAEYKKYLKLYQTGSLNTKSKDIDWPTLNAMARSQEIARDISEMVYSISPGRFIFQPTVHNKERVIVQDRLDGKILFPQNEAIQYAFFHIRIEHDPDGPYVLTL